jgi:hypothetical protein
MGAGCCVIAGYRMLSVRPRMVRMAYNESLGMHSLTGHSVVRFRGKHIEGRLPDNLASMLAPLLRMDQNSTNPKTLISLEEEAHGRDSVMIGSQIPLP